MRLSLDGLGRVQVYVSGTGEFISLEQVADIRPEWQFNRIQHRDQERTMTVEARNPGIPAPDLLAMVMPVIADFDLPAGYRWEIGGEIEDQQEANEKLASFLPIALLGIIVLLVGQFNSFRKGSIIILTIPLILIGGVIGLVVMNAAYGFMVLLGFYSLAGILINNGIVLIDRMEVLNDSIDQTIIQQDAAGYVRLNLEFHRSLYLRAQAPAMLAMVETVWLQSGPTMRQLYSKKQRQSASINHRKILAALRAGDEASLRLAVRQDVLNGLRMLAE